MLIKRIGKFRKGGGCVLNALNLRQAWSYYAVSRRA